MAHVASYHLIDRQLLVWCPDFDSWVIDGEGVGDEGSDANCFEDAVGGETVECSGLIIRVSEA